MSGRTGQITVGLLFSSLFLGFSCFQAAGKERIPNSPPAISGSEIAGLISELGDSDFIAVYQAGRKLVKIGRPAVPQLLQALDHSRSSIRLGAIIVLDQIKDPRAAPEFMRIFQDNTRKERERTAVAMSLGHMEIKESSELLISGLAEPSNNIRIASALALGMLKETRAVPYLAKMLKAENEEVKKGAAKALKEIGDNGIPQLEEILKDGDKGEQITALEILRDFNSEKSAAVLKGLLAGNDRQLQTAAAYFLSEIKDYSGKQIALQGLNDKDPKIRLFSQKTIDNINRAEIRGGIEK